MHARRSPGGPGGRVEIAGDDSPLPDDAVLPVLKENLRHEDERVRLAVVNLLVATGVAPTRGVGPRGAPDGEERRSRAPRRVPARQDRARKPPRDCSMPYGGRRAASIQIAEALAQIGRPAVGLLTQAVKDPEPRVRRGAALALGQIRPLAAGTAQKLIGRPERLRPRRSRPPSSPRSVISVREPANACRPCVPCSRTNPRRFASRPSASSFNRHHATTACSAISRACSTILTLRFSDMRSRRFVPWARRVAKRCRSSIGKLNSPDPDVRLAAAELIGSHGPAAAEAVPALTALLDDPLAETPDDRRENVGKSGKRGKTGICPVDGAPGSQASRSPGSRNIDAGKPGSRRGSRQTSSRQGAPGRLDRGASGCHEGHPAIRPPGGPLPPGHHLAGREEGESPHGPETAPPVRANRPGRAVAARTRQAPRPQARFACALLAIKFLGLAGKNARDAIPALERMRDDPSAEVRKQAEAACKQIKDHSLSI